MIHYKDYDYVKSAVINILFLLLILYLFNKGKECPKKDQKAILSLISHNNDNCKLWLKHTEK